MPNQQKLDNAAAFSEVPLVSEIDPAQPELLQHNTPSHSEAQAKIGERVVVSRDQIFISYSHCDQSFLEELRTHLKPFALSGIITYWSDRDIHPGSKWFHEIQRALERTNIAVFLLSPDFLASDFIRDHELGPLLKEAETGNVKILWLQLRECAWEETPLQDYQAIDPPSEKPLAQRERAERDAVWKRTCQIIKRLQPLSSASQ